MSPISGVTNPKRITLKGDPIYKERMLKAVDAYGDGAIVPGMLCEYANTDEVQPHASAAGFASPIFAIELPERAGADIDTPYDEDGETVLLGFFRPGDEVYAFVEAGANVSAFALLESGGGGSLQAGTTNPIARALVAVNNSAGSAPARCKVEVL